MGQRTLIQESHQTWKLIVGVIVLGLGHWLNDKTDLGLAWVATLFLAFSGAVWIAWSIRCPRCAAKWVWIAASQVPGGSVRGAGAPAACGVCGWPGEDRRKDTTSDAEPGPDTSLRSVVAFGGGLAAMFTFLPCYDVAIAHHNEDGAVLFMALVGVTLAFASITLAKHVLAGVQSLRRVLAVGGVWLSRASLVVGIPTVILSLVRIAFTGH